MESVKWNGEEKCSKGLGCLDTNSLSSQPPLLLTETGADSESHADSKIRISVPHVKLDTYPTGPWEVKIRAADTRLRERQGFIYGKSGIFNALGVSSGPMRSQNSSRDAILCVDSSRSRNLATKPAKCDENIREAEWDEQGPRFGLSQGSGALKWLGP